MASAAEFRSVLTPDLVRTFIHELLTRRIHPTFAAYLALKRQSVREGKTVGIRPDFAEFFDRFLRVPDGPAGKPYLRPFWNQQARAGQQWMNENIAGSYSPSSLRAAVSPILRVVDIGERGVSPTWTLKPEHARLARQHLASNRKIPAVPLSGFLYRDFALLTTQPPIAADLVEVFKFDFGYLNEAGGETGPVEFDELFEDDSGVRSLTAGWFGSAPAGSK